MSEESDMQWWIKTKHHLENVEVYDNAMKKLEAVKDRCLAARLIGGLYARYSTVVQEIDTILDQMCHVQKSFTVRKLMDAATTRLHELKDEMLNIDISEYHYIDGKLIELKLIPHSIEILHPKLKFPRPDDIEQLWNSIKKGERIYVPPPPEVLEAMAAELAAKEEKKKKKKAAAEPDAMALLFGGGKPKEQPEEEANKEEAPAPTEEEGATEIQPEEVKEVEPPKKEKKKIRPKMGLAIEMSEMTEEQKEALKLMETIKLSVVLLQRHERGRQARLYYGDLLTDYKTKKALAVPGAPKIVPPDPEIVEKATRTIQRVWQGHKVRHFLKRREIDRRLLIGMYEPSWRSKEELEIFEQNLEERRIIRDQNFRDYFKAVQNEKERILRVVAPGLFEDIGDEIREWFKYWYYTARAFQSIPEEDDGGTVLIIRGEFITPEEYLVEQQKKAKKKKKSKEEIAREKAKKAADLAKEKARKAAEKARDKDKKKKTDFEIKISETIGHQKLQAGDDEYEKMWKESDNLDNPVHKICMDLITEDICYETQLEIRRQVDEVMRLELEMLLISVQREKWLKKKKGKGVFKPKKPKGKKKKKKGKKKKKDPTGDRTVEDLFQELVDNGIIRTYPEAKLRDYKGDFSYQNWEKREANFDEPPTLGDVRQAVVLNCIMPLGVETLVKPKSVLIAGPRQSGKHLLANAIFNETKCVLFDLSPAVVAGKYPGKKGNVQLIHLINKMSRLLQPSIIYIDGAEKPFYKKVPKEEKELEPKRVGKFLFKKIVKTIAPEDRVLVLGITGQPWAAQAAGLKKAFQRVILIPRSDYGSVFMYWRELLMPYHGIDRNINLSALTKLTLKYPLPELRKATEAVLIPRRIIQLHYRPLEQYELLEPLVNGIGPITDKEFAKFVKWFNKTTIGKQRAKLNKLYADIREKQKPKK